MTAVIIELGNYTTLDIPPERIIKSASEIDLDVVVIVGRTKDGQLYFGSSTAGAPEILWLIENVKAYLLSSERD